MTAARVQDEANQFKSIIIPQEVILKLDPLKLDKFLEEKIKSIQSKGKSAKEVSEKTVSTISTKKHNKVVEKAKEKVDSNQKTVSTKKTDSKKKIDSKENTDYNEKIIKNKTLTKEERGKVENEIKDKKAEMLDETEKKYQNETKIETTEEIERKDKTEVETENQYEIENKEETEIGCQTNEASAEPSTKKRDECYYSVLAACATALETSDDRLTAIAKIICGLKLSNGSIMHQLQKQIADRARKIRDVKVQLYQLHLDGFVNQKEFVYFFSKYFLFTGWI